LEQRGNVMARALFKKYIRRCLPHAFIPLPAAMHIAHGADGFFRDFLANILTQRILVLLTRVFLAFFCGSGCRIRKQICIESIGLMSKDDTHGQGPAGWPTQSMLMR
jgi:hypothetical protein